MAAASIHVTALALGLAFAASARAAAPYPTPALEMLDHLRQRHHRGDWLRITTDTTRLELRVRRIDTNGLSELEARRKAPPPPEMIPWSAIARIDRRETRFRRGQITGGVVGTIVGASVGASLGARVKKVQIVPGYDAYETYGNRSAFGGWAGAFVGAAAGAWIGGRMGDRNQRERLLYLAPAATTRERPTASLVDAPRDTVAIQPPPSEPASGTPESRDAFVAPDAAAPPPSEDVTRAIRRIRSEDLLRVEGGFGSFQGYASRVGPQGLEGLRVDLDAGVTQAPPEPIAWSRIARIETRGSRAGRFALQGGLGCGVAGGLLAAAIVSGFGGGDTDAWTAAVEAGAVTGAIGAAIGGAVGAAVPAWHVVYARR